ncbi:SAV_6107 family HEPN domain-containing protein [Mobilicoccus pelagius]|uniref:SAV-6107-like HEPN domain-containing protein n=1 Tax=Mobilicoccus pelagius NBRC 104925 TaxID=1089455 RepID=H5UUR5_9MICO|nr:SAV_6107 family HEPN domain-containing protein [Mobilicoccus pelagius]GAB49473.1 hypothetical protein MOPEL_130_00800 [Mobilicoccus pelagius NBRC 104925]
MPAATTFDLLDRARSTLVRAHRSSTTNDRYIEAHLAALRSAAAVVSARAPRQVGRSHAPMRDTWTTLATLTPELTEWADYFALCGARRGALEAGEIASPREADDLLRDSETFHGLALAALGLPFETGAVDLGLAVAGRR